MEAGVIPAWNADQVVPDIRPEANPQTKDAAHAETVSCAVFFALTTSAWQDPQDRYHHSIHECADTWPLWGAESSG